MGFHAVSQCPSECRILVDQRVELFQVFDDDVDLIAVQFVNRRRRGLQLAQVGAIGVAGCLGPCGGCRLEFVGVAVGNWDADALQ